MYPFFYLFPRISFKGFVGIKQVIKSQLPEQFHPISGKVTKHVYPRWQQWHTTNRECSWKCDLDLCNRIFQYLKSNNDIFVESVVGSVIWTFV